MTALDLVYWTATFVGLAFILHGFTDCFSRDARIARKRRRNYGRISRKPGRATVMLSVRTKKA